MSFTRALVDDDLKIENGGLRNISEVDEVAQRIIVTLKHNWHEYFMNVPAGVPWYEIILGSKDKDVAEVILRGIIIEVPGVVSISSFSVSRSGRDFSIEIEVEVFVDGITEIINIAETFLLG